MREGVDELRDADARIAEAAVGRDSSSPAGLTSSPPAGAAGVLDLRPELARLRVLAALLAGTQATV